MEMFFWLVTIGEMFFYHFKHHVGASQILTFLDNPDVDNIDDAIAVLSSDYSAIRLSHKGLY